MVNDSQLEVIIAWRIATYHVPLVIMWVALMRLAIGKVSAASLSQQAGGDGKPEDGSATK